MPVGRLGTRLAGADEVNIPASMINITSANQCGHYSGTTVIIRVLLLSLLLALLLLFRSGVGGRRRAAAGSIITNSI